VDRYGTKYFRGVSRFNIKAVPIADEVILLAFCGIVVN
jgi:hypothetical protein